MASTPSPSSPATNKANETEEHPRLCRGCFYVRRQGFPCMGELTVCLRWRRPCYAAALSCLRRVTFFHQRSPTRCARMCALCQPKIHRLRIVFLGQKRKSNQRSAARNRWFLDLLYPARVADKNRIKCCTDSASLFAAAPLKNVGAGNSTVVQGKRLSGLEESQFLSLPRSVRIPIRDVNMHRH